MQVLARLFRVQYETGQRGGISHYDMLYVGRVVEKVGEGTLKNDWYSVSELEKLAPGTIFPNVLQLLQDVQLHLAAGGR